MTPELHSSLLRSQHARVPLSHAATPAGDLLIDARSCDFFSLSFVVEGLIQWAVQPPLSLLPCDAAGGSGGGGSGGGGAAPLPPRQQRWWLPEAEGGCRPNPFAAEAIRNRDEKLLEHIMHMLISHTGGEASSGSGGAAASASSPPKCFQLLTQLLLSGVPRRVTPGVIKEAILGLSHHRLRQAIRDLLRDAVRGSVPGGPATPAFPPLPVPQAQQHHSVRGFSASAGGAMSPMLHSAPPGSRGSSAAPSSSIGNSTAAAAGGGGGIFYPGGSSTTPGGFSSMPSSPGSGFPTFSLPAFGGGGGGVGWGGPASSREGSVPHTVSSFGGGTFASDSVIGKGCASAVVTQLRRSQGSGVPGESVGRRQTPTNPSFSFPGPPTPHASHGVVRKAKPRGAAAKLTAEDSEPRPLSQGALFFLYEMAGRLVPHSLVSAVSTLDRWGLQRGPHRAQPPLSDTAGGGGGSSGGSPGSCCHHHHHHHASPECCSGGSPDGSTASGVVSSWVDWTTPSPGGAAGGGVGGAENIPGCPAPSPVEYGVGDAGVEPHAPSHSCRQGGLQSLASGISVADRQKGAMHGGSPPSPGIQPPSQAPKFTGVHMEILPQQQRGGGQASSGIHSDPAGACCALLPASISGVDPFIGKRMSLGGSDIAQNRGGGPLFIPASVADGQPGLLGESSCLEIFSFFDAPKLLRGDSSAGGVWDASTPQGKSDLLREVCRAVGSSHLFGFPPSGEGNATSAPECAEAWAVRERSICEHRQFYQGLQSLGERSLAAHLMEMLASGGGDSAPQHASGSTASPSTSPSDQPLPMGAASRRRSSGSLRVSTQPPTPSPRSTGTPVSQGMSFTAQLAQAYGGVSPLVEPADKPSSESGGGSSRQEEKAGCASRGGGGAAPIMSQQRATVLASHYQGALEGVSSEMFAAISSAVLQEGGSGAAPTADLQFEALQSLAIAVEDLGIPHIAGFSEALACCAYSVLPLRSFFFMIQRGAFAISDRLALYIAEREVLKLAMDPDGTASGGSPRRQHRLRGTRRRRHTTKTLQYVTQLAMCASSSGMQIRILRAVQWCQSVLDAEAGGVVGGGGGGVGVGVGGEAPPHTTPAAGSTVEATPNASSSSASAQREAAASSAGGAERGITPVAEQRQPEGAKGRPPLPPAHLGLYEAGGEAAGAAAGDGAADAVGSSSASPQGLSGGSVNTAGRASPAPSEDAGFERVGSLRIQRVPSWESTFLESVEQSSATRRTKGAAWGSSAASPPSSPHHRSDLSDSQRVAPGQPGEVALDLSIRKVDSGVVSALPHTPVRSRGEEEEGDGGGSSGGGSFGGVATFPMEPGQHRGLARRVSDAGIAFAMHGPFCEDHSWWGDANIAQDIESFVLQSCSKEVYDTGLWGRGCASAASRYKKSVVLQSEEPSQSSRKSQQHAATAPAGMPPVGTSLSPSPQRGGSVLTDLMKDMESPDMHPTVGKSSGFVPLDLLRESWKSLDTTATLYLERQSIAAVSHGFGPLLAM